jgi:frataxin-like iron-binding protein CyaY
VSKTFDDVIQYLKHRADLHDSDWDKEPDLEKGVIHLACERAVKSCIRGLKAMKKRGKIDKDSVS